MAKYIRYFETVDEFNSAYTGGEYVEPFVAYIEENQGLAYDKVYLASLSFKKLRMLGDVPASGGTVTKDNCSYQVMAVYSDARKVDVTEDATITGSLVVEDSMVEERHSAGTLTLTAELSGVSGSASVIVYQAAFIPSVTAITLDDLTWETDIPYGGGVATKDNCSYSVTAYYDNGAECGVTQFATVIGSATVESTIITERHSAGTLTLTAEYSGFTDSDSVTIYQEAKPGYVAQPLTFNILSSGTIGYGLMHNGDLPETPEINPVQYKVNDGDWTTFTPSIGDDSHIMIPVVAGDILQFKGDNSTYCYDEGRYYYGFGNMPDTVFSVEGNIMSLINSTGFSGETTLTEPFAFGFLFGGGFCPDLISAENLVLPATVLTDSCYSGMFDDCTSLTSAPALPATTLANDCYSSMFNGCTSLTTAPALLAETLTDGCYASMFQGCTNLTTAPALPATTLAYGCYGGMFWGCTSLTTAPALPATTLASNCYYFMFAGCESLNSAPTLPAETLEESCYNSMFRGCTSLTTAPALPATTLANYCCRDMFNGCTSLTTAPALLAETLANYCYYYMFYGCTSLTTAPELPATTLASSCYQNMFNGCTSLTTAPELPAATLTSQCYSSMFYGCTSLNYIKCLATNISANNCTTNWVYGVSSTGRFVKPNATDWRSKTGANGIPANWTVEDA